jgi:hypothetical protein
LGFEQRETDSLSRPPQDGQTFAWRGIMSRAECHREQEVLDAIASGRWPNRLEDDLAHHVDNCVFCKDLGLVAEALSTDFSSAISEARVPSAGLVWWRAEIRARQESLRVASRPITLAHYIGCGCAAVLVLALLMLFDLKSLASFSLMSLIPDFLPIPLIAGCLGALAILASIALYLVVSSDE